MLIELLGLAVLGGAGVYGYKQLNKNKAATVTKPTNGLPPIVPPNPGQPPVVAAAFKADADGFISVDQFAPLLTNATITAQKRICTILALAQLDPASAAYARVKLNCAADTLAIATQKAIPDSFLPHNTANDVKLAADGKTWIIDTTKSMPSNFIVPDTATTDSDVMLYCNSYVFATEAHSGDKLTP